MDVLRRSSRSRQKAATALNIGSSRSHSVVAIALYDGAAAAGPAPEGAAAPPLLLHIEVRRIPALEVEKRRYPKDWRLRRQHKQC